jgi:hypothetical protein
MLLLLASFMMVFPSADLSAAAGNPFLGRYQGGRDDDSSYGDKEKYDHSKWHVHRCFTSSVVSSDARRRKDIARPCDSEWSHGTAAPVLSALRLTH